jgi:hypothetical protein
VTRCVLKSKNTRVVLMTSNPLRLTPKLKEMYGKPPYQAENVDGFNAPLVPYCEAARRVAQVEGAELLDIQQAFVEHAQKRGVTVDSLLSDGMHPNDAGHRIEADLLHERILALAKTQGLSITEGPRWKASGEFVLIHPACTNITHDSPNPTVLGCGLARTRDGAGDSTAGVPAQFFFGASHALDRSQRGQFGKKQIVRVLAVVVGAPTGGAGGLHVGREVVDEENLFCAQVKLSKGVRVDGSSRLHETALVGIDRILEVRKNRVPGQEIICVQIIGVGEQEERARVVQLLDQAVGGLNGGEDLLPGRSKQGALARVANDSGGLLQKGFAFHPAGLQLVFEGRQKRVDA